MLLRIHADCREVTLTRQKVRSFLSCDFLFEFTKKVNHAIKPVQFGTGWVNMPYLGQSPAYLEDSWQRSFKQKVNLIGLIE